MNRRRKRFSIIIIILVIIDSYILVSTAQPYTCERCPYTAQLYSILQEHVHKVHNKPVPILPCDKCEYVAPSRLKLKQHRSMKHEKSIFNCDKCTFSARKFSMVKRHKISEHGGFSCPHCEYTTNLLPSLR